MIFIYDYFDVSTDLIMVCWAKTFCPSVIAYKNKLVFDINGLFVPNHFSYSIRTSGFTVKQL